MLYSSEWKVGEKRIFETDELLCIDEENDTFIDVTVEVDYEENFEILEYHFGSVWQFWDQDEWPEATPQQKADLDAALRKWVDDKIDSLR